MKADVAWDRRKPVFDGSEIVHDLEESGAITFVERVESVVLKPMRKFEVVASAYGLVGAGGSHRFGTADDVGSSDMNPIAPRLTFAKAGPGFLSQANSPGLESIGFIGWTIQPLGRLIFRGCFDIEHAQSFPRRLSSDGVWELVGGPTSSTSRAARCWCAAVGDESAERQQRTALGGNEIRQTVGLAAASTRRGVAFHGGAG